MSKVLTTTNTFHLGIYGIVLKKASILLIKKSRGPYQGMLDLPGGKPEHGETPVATVAREIQEETGVKVLTEKLWDNYSAIVHHNVNENTQERLYHLGMIYLITSYDDSALQEKMDTEDSLGAHWYPLNSVTKKKLSPFALRSVSDIKKLCLPD